MFGLLLICSFCSIYAISIEKLAQFGKGDAIIQLFDRIHGLMEKLLARASHFCH